MGLDKRKFCGQKKRDKKYRERDDVGAHGIERRAQSRSDHMAKQSAGRNRAADIGHVPESQQCWDHQHQHRIAGQLDDGRVHRFAAKPPVSKKKNSYRQKKSSVTEALKEKVRAVSTDQSDPVSRRMHVRGIGGNVERRVVRAVGKQRQRDQDGDRHAQKTNQFIQTIILSWSQNAHTSLLAIGEGARRRAGGASAVARTHLELREQRNDYIKDTAVGKKD